MVATSEKPNAISHEAIEVLRENVFRVENALAARRLWSRVYTVADKVLLGGSWEESYQLRRNIQAWMHLRSVSAERAVAELANRLGFLSQATLDWVLSELGELDAQETGAAVPEWSSEIGELRYRGRIIRRIKSPRNAGNVVLILDAFQREAWARRIQDPLSGRRNPQRLREAVRNLNRGLETIAFRSDGNGNGIVWEVA